MGARPHSHVLKWVFESAMRTLRYRQAETLVRRAKWVGSAKWVGRCRFIRPDRAERHRSLLHLGLADVLLLLRPAPVRAFPVHVHLDQTEERGLCDLLKDFIELVLVRLIYCLEIALGVHQRASCGWEHEIRWHHAQDEHARQAEQGPARRHRSD